MILNNAENILVGNQQAERAYLGTIPIWESFPAEYQKIAYIEATGNQYINTGLFFSASAYHYETECELSDESGNQLFGFKYWYAHAIMIDNNIYKFCSGEYDVRNTPFAAGSKLKITVDKATKTITGENNSQTVSETFTNDFHPSSSNYPLIIGGCWNIYNDSFYGGGKGKIYSFKFSQNGILEGNFVPCYRKSDNKPGLYDTVRNQFYTNAGTGNFIVPT